MGERASILERIMAVQHTGIVAPGTPMALGADRPRGTTAREAPQVGAGAGLHGIMDQEVPAVSEAGRPRGVAAPGAPPDGGRRSRLGRRLRLFPRSLRPHGGMETVTRGNLLAPYPPKSQNAKLKTAFAGNRKYQIPAFHE